MAITARNSGYYVVYIDDAESSHHTAEREAIEKAQQAANAGHAARYEHHYTVDVTANADASADDDGDVPADDDAGDSSPTDPGNSAPDSGHDDGGTGAGSVLTDPGKKAISAAIEVDGQVATIEAVPAGKRQRLVYADGTQTPASVFNLGDGAVLVENVYADTAGPIDVGLIRIAGFGTTKEQQGDQLPAFATGRPIWLVEPTADHDAFDSSKFFGLLGGENCDLLDNYQRCPNTFMDNGLWDDSMAGTGERGSLGLLSQFDSQYLVKPNDESAALVRGQADAAMPMVPVVVDPETDELMDPRDHPHLSFNWWCLKNDRSNPIYGVSQASKYGYESEAAHAPSFGVLSVELFKTEYDRYLVESWAMFIACTMQNYGYRVGGGKSITPYGTGQDRSYAWILRQVVAAAETDKFVPGFFTTALNDLRDSANKFLDNHPDALPHYPHYNRYSDKGIAPWEFHYICMSVAFATLRGCQGYRDLYARLAPFVTQALLHPHYEQATRYTAAIRDRDSDDDDWKYASTWDDVLQITRKYNTTVDKMLDCEPGSQALADLFSADDTAIPGDLIGYPKAPDGYVAMIWAATVPMALFDIADGKEALAVLQAHERIDWSGNPKYGFDPEQNVA